MYLVIGECLPFKLKCTAHHDSWDLIWQAWIAAARHLFRWCISNRQSHYFQSTSSPHLLIVNFRHMTRLLLRLKVFGGGFANIFSCSLFLTSIYLKEARLFISRNIWADLCDRHLRNSQRSTGGVKHKAKKQSLLMRKIKRFVLPYPCLSL